MNVAIENTYRGQLRIDEPMSKHTSWRVGGTADNFYIPADLSDLQFYLASLPASTEINWVGLGSNLLVRDGGIRGVVIAPLNVLRNLHATEAGEVYVEAGVTCAKLARYAVKHDLCGADFFAGIPGTVGGALAMNAGAFGGVTWNSVKRLLMINRHGELIDRDASEFKVGYRSVSLFDGEWFAAGYFEFSPGKSGQESEVRQLLQKRNASQPIGLPSCGSVFKNPPGHHAAQLIEASGLKGFDMDGASISTKHANFIISNGSTRAAHIEALIAHIQKVVEEKFEIRLETEVRILGVTK